MQATTDNVEDIGGKSMFVDGFMAARWMEEYEPTAFHILSSTEVRCVDVESNQPIVIYLTEVGYNNMK